MGAVSMFDKKGGLDENIQGNKKSVERLLDREELLLEKLTELSALDDDASRLDQGASLKYEADTLAAYSKEMENVLKRAKKRFEEVSLKIQDGIKDDVEKAGGEIRTKNFVMKIRANPPTVIVDDLKLVPIKYRNEPKPLPPQDKWPVDKVHIKMALTKERVKKIDGVHLEQVSRVEIKLR